MSLTLKKSQYAIRAIFELAKHLGQGPVKISRIAEAQSIPPRFLEVILSQLKGSGIVASKRGYTGGYSLTRPPEQITVGEVLRHLEERNKPDAFASCDPEAACGFGDHCAFQPMWDQIQEATFKVYDTTTIQDLIRNEKRECTPEKSTHHGRSNARKSR